MQELKPDSLLNTDASSYALLLFGQTRLLVPQRDIRLLDLLDDVDLSSAPENGVGWSEFRQQRIPVYCLSARLEWRSEVEPDRTICALLEADGNFFGLLCSEVSIVKAEQIAFYETPSAMRVVDAPFSHLAMSEDVLACVSSASLLSACLPRTEEQENKYQSEAL